MKLNRAPVGPTAVTYEGGRADPHQTAAQELERAVSTCLLWEKTFYEPGSAIAARIAQLCTKVSMEEIAVLARKARTDLKLRHVPLFLVVQMARRNSASKLKSGLVAETLADVIQRPDEIGEFLALYWKDGGKAPLAKQVKVGLRRAFTKFSRFQLAKWNRDATVKLRDALFLTHAAPSNKPHMMARLNPEIAKCPFLVAPAVEKKGYRRGATLRNTDGQGKDWADLIAKTLEPADTWEVALSGGADKTATWERLLQEKQLGYMALLMNLRNMEAAKVNSVLVRAALLAGAPQSRALPFRFVSAAKAAPMYADVLSEAMTLAVTDRLPGRTLVIVDVSGSMDDQISARSQLVRWEAAGALAVLLRAMTPECRVFTFSNTLVEVMNVQGLALIHGIAHSQAHQGTYLSQALQQMQAHVPETDRIVVITDGQTADAITPPWAPHAYLLNVAPYQPSLDTQGGWVRINGWSESVVRWMALHEGQVTLGTGDEESAEEAQEG